MKKYIFTLIFILMFASTVIAADSTSLYNTSVLGSDIEKGSLGGVPVGSVIAWPFGNNPEDPENWLEFSGQGISQTEYPELYAYTGGAVPNFNGMFLRGHGSQNHTQNNGANVGYTNTNYASGTLGQIQGDSTRRLTGRFWVDRHSTISVKGSNPFYDYDSKSGRSGSGKGNGHQIAFDTIRSLPTDNEIRPVNIAVRYLIRAKP